MTEHEVIVAGAGPTGLMLAGELALAGVDVVIVEPRINQEVEGSRAGGLLARSIEVLDQRGIAERFLDAGYVVPVQGFGGTTLDVSDFPSRHNYVLALWQAKFEPILAAWVEELGVPVLRGRTVVGFTQDDTGVDLEISDGASLRGQFVVGCDGGRSTIRKTAGIDFVGSDATTSWLIAEVEMDEEPELGIRHDSAGSHGLSRLDPEGLIRVLFTERPMRTGDPTLDELRSALVGMYGTDFGLRTANWISRFTDMTRQAVSYRQGRVLLAGDAAHVHPPHGGQGLNTGLQDAVNLGWKLAQVVNHTSPTSLLDTYHAERHPVGARAIHNTMAQVALTTPGDRHEALRDITYRLLGMNEPRRHVGAMLAGLDIRYDLGEGHPLLGRRMPDLDLQIGDGSARTFSLLHEAKPVFLALGETAEFDLGPWAGRVRRVDARYDGSWELPVLGEIAAPPAVLIRPDGYVAWAGDTIGSGLSGALELWFGPAGT